MKILIESVVNGYIITSYWMETSEDGERQWESKDVEILQRNEGEGDNALLKRLLEKVAEHTGYNYDKYGRENLKITFDEKGRKLEDND